MTDRTITLPSDLIERLESIAEAQGRTVQEVVSNLLEQHISPREGNWALAVAEGMEAADIAWKDEPEALSNSRNDYKEHLRARWLRSQTTQ